MSRGGRRRNLLPVSGAGPTAPATARRPAGRTLREGEGGLGRGWGGGVGWSGGGLLRLNVPADL